MNAYAQRLKDIYAELQKSKLAEGDYSHEAVIEFENILNKANPLTDTEKSFSETIRHLKHVTGSQLPWFLQNNSVPYYSLTLDGNSIAQALELRGRVFIDWNRFQDKWEVQIKAKNSFVDTVSSREGKGKSVNGKKGKDSGKRGEYQHNDRNDRNDKLYASHPKDKYNKSRKYTEMKPLTGDTINKIINEFSEPAVLPTSPAAAPVETASREVLEFMNNISEESWADAK